MKTFFLALLVFCSLNGFATNYYFSSSSGDDSRTALQAQSPLTPWRSLDKLNSFFPNVQPGDVIMFQRGDVFYGSIKLSKSGTSGNRIVFDAFGQGATPVISGFTNVSSWSNLGNNIWESTQGVSAMPAINIVKINGVNTGMGRYPNTGYLTYETYAGNTTITSSFINSATTNWTGAEVVLKKTKWILDHRPITSHSGGTLTYSGGGYNGRSKYGFFIQNDSRTLDQQNEWYFNPSTKKIRVYSTAAPANVQVSAIDTLVYMAYSNYITFNNLSFRGANTNAFWVSSCSNLIIQNCDIQFCYNGITGRDYGASSANFVLQNSVINHTANNAIYLSEEFSGATLLNNSIVNTALIPGAGGNGDGTYNAINLHGVSGTIKYNSIDSVGYNGITFYGSSMNVSYNKVNAFCMVKSDGGAIYTQGTSANITIANNIVVNGIGNVEGVFNALGVGVIAIYCDGSVSDIHVMNNSIGNISNGGIYLHNPSNVEVKNNTVYNCSYTALLIKNDSSDFYIRNLLITNNIFLAKEKAQKLARIITLNDDIASFGVIDSNYYSRPVDDSLIITSQPHGENIASDNYTLAQWQAYSHLDAHSLKSPKKITNTGDLRFEYNAGLSGKVINLDAAYIDVKGKSYSGSITLLPYTSLILIRTGTITNKPPTVSLTTPATNATFTAPASVSLNATAADDGSIASVSFYNGSTLLATVSASPYSFAWNNVAAGTYAITAKATDNTGLSTTSTAVSVTVSPLVINLPPVVSITNPVSNAIFTAPATFTVSASASDNVSVASVGFYNGSTLLATVTSSPYTFTWNNVPAGTYSITARATDNAGLFTISAMVPVTVLPLVINQPPAVTITNPVNNAIATAPASFNLNASATDDGSVASVAFYNGSTLLATVAASPYTFTWTNVAAGNYSITARATDNAGLFTTSAPIGVTVLPVVINQPPVVNITGPVNNAVFTAPALITLNASATDDKSVASVGFYNGNILLATVSASPYSYTLTNVPAGTYTITAKATDNAGLVTISSPVAVTVLPVVINQPPVVNITGPVNNAVFTAPALVNLSATATDDVSISNVGFYNGNILLATVSASPYAFTWTNVAAGTYSITAKATDNAGLVTISSPVSINVSPVVAIPSPPSINFVSPANNTIYPVNSTITLNVSASDAGGSVAKVEFFNGTTLLNTSYAAPFSYSWNNVPAGNYSITARATDNDGLTSTAGISVSVLASVPPVVNMTAPGNNTSYRDPATISMAASASDQNGSITRVEFFNGTTLLATRYTSPYTFTWTNVHAGNYSLRAKATDNDGLTTLSAPVAVSVTAIGAPVVYITSPVTNTVFNYRATITVTATAYDNGYISKVDFFSGSTLIYTRRGWPYSFTATNVSTGTYVITARATDNRGNTTMSLPVTIYVKAGSAARASSVSVVPGAPADGATPTGISPMISNDPSTENIGTADSDGQEIGNIRVVPNPAVNKIQLRFDHWQVYQQSNVEIYNAAGALIKSYPVVISGKKVEVDVSSLNTGIYFIGLSGNHGKLKKKFVKVK